VSGWIAEARARRNVLDVAAAIGLVARGRHRWGPCPGCGAETTGAHDRRGPLGVSADGNGWRCFPCGARGDSVELAALVLEGARVGDLDDDRRARVRAWFDVAPEAPRPRPGRPVAVPPPVYPPPAEVAALWAACGPLTGAPGFAELRAWLRDVRGIDWRYLEGLDVVRAAPPGDSPAWPEWARNVARHADIYRFAMPLYDATGAIRSIRFRALTARRVAASNPDRLTWEPVAAPIGKGTSVAGYSTKGLTLADPWGAALLAGGTLPPDVWTGEVWILEGEPDLWWALSAEPPIPGVPRGALLSIPGSGAWTADLAARIPDGATVNVATDDDPAGDEYAAMIAASLRARCNVYRVRPKGSDTGSVRGSGRV
jgi:hypothetical protein